MKENHWGRGKEVLGGKASLFLACVKLLFEQWTYCVKMRYDWWGLSGLWLGGVTSVGANIPDTNPPSENWLSESHSCVSLPVWVMLLWLFPLCYLLNFLIKKKKTLKTYLTFHLCHLFQKGTMSTRAKVSKEERQHWKGVDGNQWKSQREITSEGT